MRRSRGPEHVPSSWGAATLPDPPRLTALRLIRCACAVAVVAAACPAARGLSCYLLQRSPMHLGR